jgi:hypothetical protein
MNSPTDLLGTGAGIVLENPKEEGMQNQNPSVAAAVRSSVASAAAVVANSRLLPLPLAYDSQHLSLFPFLDLHLPSSPPTLGRELNHGSDVVSAWLGQIVVLGGNQRRCRNKRR